MLGVQSFRSGGGRLFLNMRKTGLSCQAIVNVGLFVTFAGATAWGSLSAACPGTSPAVATKTLSSINTGGGCEITDKVFSNFSSNPAGDIATIEMLNTSVAGTVASNTITGLLANFDAPGLWQL